ncbi:MAG: HisA/HisF-related TIM barrel protein [Kangiellaceae bacterium]|nr:HisA/HisF-related TIM barrel protein [Kangiellaceae bacterium]
MQLVPVIEIRQGKCVHAEHKDGLVDHIVSEDPLETVAHWAEKGIKRIHFVDVDAIKSGEPENVDLLTEIKEQNPTVVIQVIGGIRCLDSAFIWMDAGADFLVLNGRTIRQGNLLSEICLEFPGRVLAEMDNRHGKVESKDGAKKTQFETMVNQLDEEGVIGLVVTEVPETGHVNGRELLKVNELSQRVNMPIFANGGVRSMDDLKMLLENHAERLTGVVIGKVIHSKEFSLDVTQKLLGEYQQVV